MQHIQRLIATTVVLCTVQLSACVEIGEQLPMTKTPRQPDYPTLTQSEGSSGTPLPNSSPMNTAPLPNSSPVGTPVVTKPPLYDQALLLYYAGELDTARSLLDELLVVSPDDIPARNLRGLILQDQGDYDTAIEEFDHVIASDPENPEGYTNRGITYLIRDDIVEAERDLREAVKIDPTFGLAQYNLGQLLFADVRYEEAAKQLEVAAEITQDDSDIWFQLGIVYDRLGQPEAAIDAFTHSITIEQGFSGTTYYLRGLAYLDLDTRDGSERAVQDFSEAMNLGEAENDIYFYRGVANYKLDRYQQAVDDMTKVINADQYYGEAYYYRSLSYAALGDDQRSQQDITRALKELSIMEVEDAP